MAIPSGAAQKQAILNQMYAQNPFAKIVRNVADAYKNALQSLTTTQPAPPVQPAPHRPALQGRPVYSILPYKPTLQGRPVYSIMPYRTNRGKFVTALVRSVPRVL